MGTQTRKLLWCLNKRQQGPELGRGRGNGGDGMGGDVIMYVRDLATAWKELQQGERESEAKQVWGGIELLVWKY